MNMAENAMVLGEYDTRPEMTDADVSERIEELEEELCTDRRDSLIEELEGDGDFVRQVVTVLLSESDDKLGELRDMLDGKVREYAQWLADVEP